MGWIIPREHASALACLQGSGNHLLQFILCYKISSWWPLYLLPYRRFWAFLMLERTETRRFGRYKCLGTCRGDCGVCWL